MMKQLSKNLYGILTTFGFMNSYVLDSGDGLVVIDTGTSPKHIMLLEKGLLTRGWSFADVKHILITHCHYDHIGGLAYLQTQCDAPTYAHSADIPVIRGDEPPAFPDEKAFGVVGRMLLRTIQKRDFPTGRVDVALQDNQVLGNIYPNLTVIHLPGHSYGQVGFWMPEEKILIGGDVMFHTPLGMTMPFRVASPDWEEAKRSIKRVAGMAVDGICLGHGRPLMQAAQAKIAKLAQRL